MKGWQTPGYLIGSALASWLVMVLPAAGQQSLATTGTLIRVVGTGRVGFSPDGTPAMEARINLPHGPVFDAAGTMFFGDTLNQRVRKVDAGGTISTVAGIGATKSLNEDVPATEAGLRGPFDLSVDREGNLFIADTGFLREDKMGERDRILKVVGVAAPGLLAGRLFPKPQP